MSGTQNRIRRSAVLIIALFMVAVVSSPSLVAATQSAAEATPAVPTDAVASVSPEQQLIEKYAPIAGLKDQEEACDADGEPYLPVSVDSVLGHPDVVLKKATGSSSAVDETVATAPTAQDLFGKGSDYYLDLPGNPRRAGCTYEHWFKDTSPGATPTTYAHIVTDGANRLVVQYWFYYVFNRFNNTHESDWEMMQIFFEVGTVAEALQTEPTSVAMAQHGGGETSDWTDPKLQREGTHPIVFSAAGSHASQYDSAVYLGWGENGTGFGCDITTGPTSFIPLTPILLPSTVSDPASEFSWLSFTGRWGERKSGEYNGPTGPSTKTQWKSPFLWQTKLRDSSIVVPAAETLGPAPTSVFCSLSSAGSNLYRVVGESKKTLIPAALALLAAIGLMIRLSWSTVRGALALYRRRWRTFVAIGLWLIPIGIIFNGFEYIVTDLPPGSTMIDLLGRTPGSYYAVALLTLIVQHLVSLVLVGPVVIEVFEEMDRGEAVSLREAWRRTWEQFPHLVGSVGRATLIIVLLSITLIGVPVAIWLLVRWLFVAQATMLDESFGKAALDTSSAAVRGRWWRVALISISMLILAAAPGAIIGLGLLVFGSVSVQLTNAISSLAYVITVPLSLLGLTVLYRQRKSQAPAPTVNEDPRAFVDTQTA